VVNIDNSLLTSILSLLLDRRIRKYLREEYRTVEVLAGIIKEILQSENKTK